VWEGQRIGLSRNASLGDCFMGPNEVRDYEMLMKRRLGGEMNAESVWVC